MKRSGGSCRANVGKKVDRRIVVEAILMTPIWWVNAAARRRTFTRYGSVQFESAALGVAFLGLVDDGQGAVGVFQAGSLEHEAADLPVEMEKELLAHWAVVIEEFRDVPEKGLVRISAVVYVERMNHKGIIIGKKGEMLRDCSDQPLLSSLAGESTSCGRFQRYGYRHCGRCVPCQVRRAAFLKWGTADSTDYVYSDLGRRDEDHGCGEQRVQRAPPDPQEARGLRLKEQRRRGCAR